MQATTRLCTSLGRGGLRTSAASGACRLGQGAGLQAPEAAVDAVAGVSAWIVYLGRGRRAVGD